MRIRNAETTRTMRRIVAFTSAHSCESPETCQIGFNLEIKITELARINQIRGLDVFFLTRLFRLPYFAGNCERVPITSVVRASSPGLGLPPAGLLCMQSIEGGIALQGGTTCTSILLYGNSRSGWRHNWRPSFFRVRKICRSGRGPWNILTTIASAPFFT